MINDKDSENFLWLVGLKIGSKSAQWAHHRLIISERKIEMNTNWMCYFLYNSGAIVGPSELESKIHSPLKTYNNHISFTAITNKKVVRKLRQPHTTHYRVILQEINPDIQICFIWHHPPYTCH